MNFRNLMVSAAIAAGLVAMSAPAAAQCVCCCLTPEVHDPVNALKLASILETAKTVTSIYNAGSSLAGKLQSAVGSKGSIPTTSYQTIAATPPDLSPVLSISAPGLSAPAPDFSSSAASQTWITATFFSSATDAASVTAIAQRRNLSFVLAARYAYAVALASRADAAASKARAAQLLQQGNSAQNIREQIAAVQQTIEAVRAEAVALQRIDEARLALRATQALAGQQSLSGVAGI